MIIYRFSGFRKPENLINIKFKNRQKPRMFDVNVRMDSLVAESGRSKIISSSILSIQSAQQSLAP